MRPQRHLARQSRRSAWNAAVWMSRAFGNAREPLVPFGASDPTSRRTACREASQSDACKIYGRPPGVARCWRWSPRTSDDRGESCCLLWRPRGRRHRGSESRHAPSSEPAQRGGNNLCEGVCRKGQRRGAGIPPAPSAAREGLPSVALSERQGQPGRGRRARGGAGRHPLGPLGVHGCGGAGSGRAGRQRREGCRQAKSSGLHAGRVVLGAAEGRITNAFGPCRGRRGQVAHRR